MDKKDIWGSRVSILSGFTIRNGKGWYGGGICCCNNSSPTITNCTISGNSTSIYGGGIYCISSSPTIANCTISGNSASDGGGIYCISSLPIITNCIISGNSASWSGGGIYCWSSSPTIINCTISGNSASWNGGGIYCISSSSPTITNCTISGNSASPNGGGICCGRDSSLTVVNNILWGDSPDEIYLDSSSINITYSDIEGGWTGKGNIDADPLFVGGGDYHLIGGSPCIDTGTGAPADDIDGDSRPQSAGYDMGSDEYVVVKPPSLDIKANGEDGPITITPNDTLSITIKLDAGDYEGKDARLWILEKTPSGWYWYKLDEDKWVKGRKANKGPLFDITPPDEIFKGKLSKGSYTFQIKVKVSDKLYSDRVKVKVK